ncbi:laccase [Artemisia annua]|uniref:Laccase n=1 Tax=Artemisia annua TaxID=35608 RepID=A0A2U1PKT4_ARTAN|nr:laccase [Artemisia annua]
MTGNSYVYDFNITGQRGTLWWHAYILWLRATVYGALVILPKQATPSPFPRPDGEQVIVFGEWWHVDVEEVVKQGNALGLPPNMSDAHTINGKPGPLFPCSEKHDLLEFFLDLDPVTDTFAMEVEQGKKYLLRIVNAALNDELFFAIAGHNMTVVEIEAGIAPGQTTNVLVSANQAPGRYFMEVRPFQDVPIPVDNKTATTIFQYKNIPTTVIPTLPHLPLPNDTAFALSYNNKLRSLNTPNFPANVPLKVDRHLLFTIGLGKSVCSTCINCTRLSASLNNITFVMPKTGLLQAHYFNVKGVFNTDFPDKPPKAFNYTGAPLTANLFTTKGTRLSKIAFNSTVELVIQDTNVLSVESHPFHLHGFNFFVVGTGIGNFDPAKDPAKYNLVAPPERNIVGAPTGGWAAIRFRADNPGVWFFHCHLELHTGWGLKTAFVVEDGSGKDLAVCPPPKDLPSC